MLSAGPTPRVKLDDWRFALKVDVKAKLRDPATYAIVGKPLARPDIPGKVMGRHVFVHDVRVALDAAYLEAAANDHESVEVEHLALALLVDHPDRTEVTAVRLEGVLEPLTSSMMKLGPDEPM